VVVQLATLVQVTGSFVLVADRLKLEGEDLRSMSLAAMAGALPIWCTAWWRNVCFRDIAPPAHHRVLRSIASSSVKLCKLSVFAGITKLGIAQPAFLPVSLDNIDDFALAILVWNYRSG